ncbi:discoidin domain-containing protein [Eubacterium sp. CAG:156]|uniref:discoidin domain-containing protein n=1 Tax=Eubacterium sp. CAG:156 TaxID=1262880 RepID=UPI000337B914|nr:f5/8 type C domain protein [Eubacterium sp. CAG:156]
MKKLKLLAMSLAAIMTVSTVGMGDYAAVKGDDTTTCEVSTFSGNECVTYGKTVTSDMGVSSGSLSDIVDGNENNLWIAGGRITGTITIDLGAYYKISDFKIVFEASRDDGEWGYTVEGTDDESNWDMLWDNSNNSDNSKSLTGKNTEYGENVYNKLRIKITNIPGTLVWTAMREFCAYGVKISDSKVTNVAKGCSAKGYYSDGGSGNEAGVFPATNVTDGNTSSRWGGNGNGNGQYIIVDLGKTRKIEGFNVLFQKDAYPTLEEAKADTSDSESQYGQTWKYVIEGSNDQSTWTMLWNNNENDDNENWSRSQSGECEDKDNEYQYVRFTINRMPLHQSSTAQVWAAMYEFNIYSPVYTVTEGDSTTEAAYGDTYTVNGDATYGYYYNEEMYKKGDGLTVKDNINLEAVNTLNLSIANGAGIRTADPYGMRFQTTVTSDNYKAVNEQKAIKEGMLITTKDLYEKNGNVLEKESNYTKLDIANNGWYGENESAKTNTYCGSVVNIKEENFARGFIANAYVTITYKDGTTTTVYSDNMSDTRSVAQVAYNMTQSEGGQAELNRLGETIKAMIEGWATKYNANQAQ